MVAGLLGAGAVAVWFLIFDGSRGRPLETPALLAAVLLHGAAAGAVSMTALVIEYTVLHLGAFVLIGIAAAALISAAEQESGLIVALIIFFAAFEVFFIAVVIFLGPSVTWTISWWSVLVGNLLATGAMLAFFYLRHRALGRVLFGPWIAVVREGVVAGVIGAAAVAVWFIAYDTGMGQPLRTPALLGAMLLQGLRNPAALHITAGVVLGYTVLHGAAFILFGVLAAVLLAFSEREPMLLLAVFILFTCFEVVFFGAVMFIDETLVESLGWWTIFVGNILAATAMLWYFLRRHRDLRGRLVDGWHAKV